MKKVYNSPKAYIHSVNTHQMIATSVGLSNDPANTTYPGGGDVKIEILDDDNIWEDLFE